MLILEIALHLQINKLQINKLQSGELDTSYTVAKYIGSDQNVQTVGPEKLLLYVGPCEFCIQANQKNPSPNEGGGYTMNVLKAVDSTDLKNIVNETDYETEDIGGKIAFYPIPYYRCPSAVQDVYEFDANEEIQSYTVKLYFGYGQEFPPITLQGDLAKYYSLEAMDNESILLPNNLFIYSYYSVDNGLLIGDIPESDIQLVNMTLAQIFNQNQSESNNSGQDNPPGQDDNNQNTPEEEEEEEENLNNSTQNTNLDNFFFATSIMLWVMLVFICLTFILMIVVNANKSHVLPPRPRQPTSIFGNRF